MTDDTKKPAPPASSPPKLIPDTAYPVSARLFGKEFWRPGDSPEQTQVNLRALVREMEAQGKL